MEIPRDEGWNGHLTVSPRIVEVNGPGLIEQIRELAVRPGPK